MVSSPRRTLTCPPLPGPGNQTPTTFLRERNVVQPRSPVPHRLTCASSGLVSVRRRTGSRGSPAPPVSSTEAPTAPSVAVATPPVSTRLPLEVLLGLLFPQSPTTSPYTMIWTAVRLSDTEGNSTAVPFLRPRRTDWNPTRPRTGSSLSSTPSPNVHPDPLPLGPPPPGPLAPGSKTRVDIQ